MEDKLKKFVQSHRDEFDFFEPSPNLWQDISGKLGEKKSSKVIRFYQRPEWRYAASVVLLIGLGYGLLQYGKSLNTNHLLMNEISMTQLAPEMAEVETYYLSVINQKKREQSRFDLKQLGLDKDFRRELYQLDSSYVQLKKELYSNPNKQKVIDAMVQNLQIRMDILNQQLEVLSRIKQVKKENKDANIHI